METDIGPAKPISLTILLPFVTIFLKCEWAFPCPMSPAWLFLVRCACGSSHSQTTQYILQVALPKTHTLTLKDVKVIKTIAKKNSPDFFFGTYSLCGVNRKFRPQRSNVSLDIRLFQRKSLARWLDGPESSVLANVPKIGSDPSVKDPNLIMTRFKLGWYWDRLFMVVTGWSLGGMSGMSVWCCQMAQLWLCPSFSTFNEPAM